MLQMKLEPPATHYLNSAIGWTELGNAVEALRELDGISAEFQSHPEVMETLWQALAQLKLWKDCVSLAEEVIRLHPGKSAGWVHRSFALHEMGETEDALQMLLPALARFPDSWLIRYNLACYYCRTKNPEQGMRFFEQACRLGDFSQLKSMALEDDDLLDIRSKIAASNAGGFV